MNSRRHRTVIPETKAAEEVTERIVLADISEAFWASGWEEEASRTLKITSSHFKTLINPVLVH